MPDRSDDDGMTREPVRLPVAQIVLAVAVLCASIAAYVVEDPSANRVAHVLQ